MPLEAKGKLYPPCVRSLTLPGNETWPVKEEDVIRLGKNDARMVRWPEDITLEVFHKKLPHLCK